MTDRPTDPNDETQPHDPAGWRQSSADASSNAPGAGAEADSVLGESPWAPRRPDAAPAPGGTAASGAASYSPAPEPRTDWTHAQWAANDPTPEHWFETAAPGAARPLTPPPRRGR